MLQINKDSRTLAAFYDWDSGGHIYDDLFSRTANPIDRKIGENYF